ncbi:MAG TPA: hypothetical protein VNI01_03065, partial [Elusimicrobiota bacterium]|nr:hypothetical protein [Elusimicrobiota bacterium]
MPGLSRRIAASLVVGQLVLAPSLQAAGVVARSTRAGASPAPLAAFAPSGEVPAALLLTSPTPLDLAAPAPALANEPLSPAPLERVVEAAPGEPLPMAASASSASPEPGQNGGASAAARELASVREAAAPAMAASADAGSAPGDLHRSGRTLEAALTGAGAPASAGEPAPPAETGPWGPVPTSLARSRAPAPVLRRAAVPIGAAAAAAILPHGVWAQLWPAALVLAGAALLLLVEAWTGGGLMRWAHQAATRPSLDRALRQDAAGLFDFPAGREEPDRAEVSAFVGRWLDANGAGRKELAEEALSDPALWREKLVAAQLAGGEEALDAIKRSPRAGLEPVSAVLKTVLAKRGTSALLERREVLRRLARLSPEADAPAPRRRLPLWAAATAASAAFAFLGWTGYHALEHGRSQDAAQRDAREIFYGPESFIFADDYRDPRIPGEVLPLLRRWQSLTDDDAPALSRAVETLRASPDPRSDNVLEAVFARADLLPLTPESERLLLSALIEREHEGIWRHMRRALEERRATEAEVERLLLMMELSQGAGDRTLQNVFYFTKARAPRVKQAAAKTIRDWLDDPAKGDRYARIEALLERYESDDALVLEAERCLLGFLGRPGTPPPASEAAGKAEKVLARVLEIAAKSDERRPRAFRAVRAGEEDARLIPPRVLGVLALLKEELEKAPPSPGLQWAARRQVDMAAAGLVEEARTFLPDRSEELRLRRVLPYAGQVRASGYARSHVRALHEILEGPAPEEPDPAKEAARREYVHRALKATERMLALADAAG